MRFSPDHGQPDNAAEAYYDYLDNCTDWGGEAMTFEAWSSWRRDKRNRGLTQRLASQ